MKTLVKSLVPEKYHWRVYNRLKDLTSWRSKSYSSLGEDLIVSQLVSKRKNGFYVDVGAFHPFKYSNTYYFYKYFGWKGINIEPNPQGFLLFEKNRKRDLNLNLGVAKSAGELNYYMFSDGLYNTFDEKRKNELVDEGMDLINQKTIAVQPLAQILHEHLNNVEIDFLNVDVEMLDLEVLESIDWNKIKPEVIAIEDHSFKMETYSESPIYQFLSKQGYSLESKCHFTTLYKRQS